MTNSRVVFEVSEQDLNKVLDEKLATIQKTSVLGRFRDRLVSAKCVAEIHGKKPDTVLKYAKAGKIPSVREGQFFKFSLAEALEFDFTALRRKYETHQPNQQ